MWQVIRNRDFALLWCAGLVSLIGDWMLIVALPVTVYQLTGSAVATSGIVIVGRIPSLVLGSVAGVFVDRWNRQRTMVVVNLVRAPILLLLLAVTNADRVWIVYVVAFAASALAQFFSPAENALLPQLVDPADLVPANALNALNNNLARLIGPALGGVVAGLYGLGGVALADAASFLVAGALIAAIARSANPRRDPGTDGRSRRAVWLEWQAGLRIIRASRALTVLFAVMAISSLGEGVMGSVFWVFVDEALGGGASEAGWMMSAQAVGGLMGSLLVGGWARRAAPIRLVGLGAIGLGLVDLVLFNYPAVISGIWLGLALFWLAGFPVTAFSTGFLTTIQTETEDAYRGRVFGALNAIMALLLMVGAIIAGVATERFGVVTVLTIQSVSYLVAGAFALTVMGQWSGGSTQAKAPDRKRDLRPDSPLES